MAAILSEQELISSWVRGEAALATAREAAVIARSAAVAIVAATPESIDPVRLWRETRNVGYPILPLVRPRRRSRTRSLSCSLHSPHTSPARR